MRLFKRCSDSKGVIYIGEGAFYRCDSITNITVESEILDIQHQITRH